MTIINESQRLSALAKEAGEDFLAFQFEQLVTWLHDDSGEPFAPKPNIPQCAHFGEAGSFVQADRRDILGAANDGDHLAEPASCTFFDENAKQRTAYSLTAHVGRQVDGILDSIAVDRLLAIRASKPEANYALIAFDYEIGVVAGRQGGHTAKHLRFVRRDRLKASAVVDDVLAIYGGYRWNIARICWPLDEVAQGSVRK